jgi:NADH-quinone oxidoreductase subunit L
VYVSFSIAPFQAILLLAVSLVSLVVQIYSCGYMRQERRFATYFAYLSLFTFAMLNLIASANLLQLYIFWELVGVCSFLLIGFYYTKPAAVRAAQKAFVMTRLADIGLFVAICLIYWQTGSFELVALKGAVAQQAFPGFLLTTCSLLILLAAMGKSGQFPLHTWLPDAMEGPTPVSALIHAATMVAAGVYLIALLHFMFVSSAVALDVLAWVGGFTAFFAATIALTQHDLKRILAYSTVSQLGLMFLGLSTAKTFPSYFHLLTHAGFKAVLFLAAGGVLLMLQHQQDVRDMGGVGRRQPMLAASFLIGSLALAGIPPFAGFFSKELLLAGLGSKDWQLFLLAGVLTSFCTALYIFKLFFQVFWGFYQGTEVIQNVSRWVVVSTACLAMLSIPVGWLNWGGRLADWVGQSGDFALHLQGRAGLILLSSVLGLAVAYAWYARRQKAAWLKRSVWAKLFAPIYLLVVNKYYVDELYEVLLVRPVQKMSRLLQTIERSVLGGLLSLLTTAVNSLGRGLGVGLQTGQLQFYTLLSLASFLVLYFSLAGGRLLP